jgi:mono/diheme cytochrome c family protein
LARHQGQAVRLPPGGTVRVRLILGTTIGACVAVLVWSQAPVAGQSSKTAPTTAGKTPAVPSPTAPAPRPAPALPRTGAAAPASPAATAADLAAQRQLLDQYCVTCHNARLKTANLLLDELDLAQLGRQGEVAEKVIRRVRAGLMPPSGVKRPDQTALDGLVAWMERTVDASAPLHLPAPGLHRLNRTEYANAIRDLLSLEVDATRFLPPDDSTRGFDNIAGALTMSPALMEAYLSAAGKISRLAIGSNTAPTQAVFDVPADTAQNHHVEGLPFGTRGGILIGHEFPADGLYSFTVKGVTGYFQAVLGGVKGEQLEVTIDGERVKLFDWDKEIANTTGLGQATPRVAVKAGFHRVGVTFLATNDIPGTELNRPFQRTMNTPGSIPGFLFYPHVGQVTIDGPFDAVPATDTPSRRAIFSCRPATAREEVTCTRSIVSTLARRAFRRPVTPGDLRLLMEFYQDGRAEGGTFDAGVEAVVQRILADPEFIYRGEREPSGLAAGRAYRVTDLALASRLAFFLWSSIPDDELIDVAAQRRLREAGMLERQVRRMLKDARADALVANFTGQWLGVRSLKTAEPVVNLFPDFDDNLRQAYRREVELFFGSVVRDDRSILDLLTANDTYVNERLAKHYGIPNIYGPQFRRVALPPALDVRRGLLGKGALLTVTSNAARTSPVTRGKWYLQTFLGVSPPDPPPNVPALQEKAVDTTGNQIAPTVRQTLEAHRRNAACASCHQIFEPMGLALENFDAVGAWRTQDEGQPIDATATLPDGTRVDGVAALRASLATRGDQFARVVAEKLLTYALGRGVESEDMPTVRSVVREAAARKYAFSALVMAIVRSQAFQMNMKGADPAVQTASHATPAPLRAAR